MCKIRACPQGTCMMRTGSCCGTKCLALNNNVKDDDGTYNDGSNNDGPTTNPNGKPPSDLNGVWGPPVTGKLNCPPPNGRCAGVPSRRPNRLCKDGSMGGPVCADLSGTCTWTIRKCPSQAPPTPSPPSNCRKVINRLGQTITVCHATAHHTKSIACTSCENRQRQGENVYCGSVCNRGGH